MWNKLYFWRQSCDSVCVCVFQIWLIRNYLCYHSSEKTTKKQQQTNANPFLGPWKF